MSKRRFVDEEDVESEIDEYGSLEDFIDGDSQENRDKDEDRNRDKPKSRHKIHVSKNATMPEDLFFTQPPEREVHLHRIEPFYWQRPRSNNPAPHVDPPPEPTDALNLESVNDKPGHRPSPRETSSNALDLDSVNDKTRQRPRSRGTSPDALDLESINDKTGQRPRSRGTNPDALDLESINDKTGQRPSPWETSPNALDVDLLADLPSDAFSSPPKPVRAPSGPLRQTTLFGTQTTATRPSTVRRAWPVARKDEPPTHHELDETAMQTWVYPTNLGRIRDYQFNVVSGGLFNNTLVALPTGLGKTFIAATIMLNWYRWTRNAQIAFVAPTRPLVAQQVKACFEIAGIPKADTVLMTGTTPPGIRAEEWQARRVFFMTPQTILNDLKSGIANAKRIVLLVVDEAHRATGQYAYVELVEFLRRHNPSFRVLALTATPGASVESVQEVIEKLSISRVEIRTEESIDIRQYVHSRKTDIAVFDVSEEMEMVMGMYAEALQSSVTRLHGLGVLFSRDPLILTAYGCTMAMDKWCKSDAGRNSHSSVKFMVMHSIKTLARVSHALQLLRYHGIGPFYHKLVGFRDELHENGKKGSKDGNAIVGHESFRKMMDRVKSWINKSDFVGHPKLEYLQNTVLSHFVEASEGHGDVDPASTRIMIFSQYRDSAEDIVRVLKRNEPMIRPHVFVGQASTKGSEGMGQKEQLEIIRKFKEGIFNTLVATSIGEEGLDIGEVDLILCYDASASPIRMLQRMGRTGRKRAGRIVLMLMRGKEETDFAKAKDGYEKIQREIALGQNFVYSDSSCRIVPRAINPVPDKRVVEIPVENTQADLPEPAPRKRPPKRPPKRFHMPDGVQTGFVAASRFDVSSSPVGTEPLERVLLTSDEQACFERRYLEIQGDEAEMIEAPRLNTTKQSWLRPIVAVSHGHRSRRFVQTLARFGQDVSAYESRLSLRDMEAGKAQATKRAQSLAGRFPTPISASPDSVRPSEEDSRSPGTRFSQQDSRSIGKRFYQQDGQSPEKHSWQQNSQSPGRHLQNSQSPGKHLQNSPYKSQTPFYVSQKRDESSGEELPEFGELLKRPRRLRRLDSEG